MADNRVPFSVDESETSRYGDRGGSDLWPLGPQDCNMFASKIDWPASETLIAQVHGANPRPRH